MSEAIKKELIQLVFQKFHSESFIYNVLSGLKTDEEGQKMIDYLKQTESPTKTDVEEKMISIRGLIKR